MKGRPVWQGDWTNAQGLRRRRALSESKATAQKILSKIIHERDLELAGMGIERGLSLSIEELARQYVGNLRTRSVRQSSIKAVEASLERLRVDLHARTVRDLTVPALIRWQQERVHDGASNKTINNQAGALKAALAHSVRLGQLAANPLAGLRGLPIGAKHQRRRPRALTEWEIARLLAAAAESDQIAERRGKRGVIVARDRPFPREPFLRALILTGARYGELRQATWADLDVERGLLTLRAETTKTARERSIPLQPSLVEALLRLPAEFARVTGASPSSGSPIFVSPLGKPWPANTGNLLKFLQQLYARIGLLRVDAKGKVISSTDEFGRSLGVHTCRHSMATRLARAGAPLTHAQLLLGHSSIDTTARFYTHLRAEETRASIDLLPSIPEVAILPTAQVSDPLGVAQARAKR